MFKRVAFITKNVKLTNLKGTLIKLNSFVNKINVSCINLLAHKLTRIESYTILIKNSKETINKSKKIKNKPEKNECH